MELVPIVQLTLGIFAGLLVLALTISYISVKLKRRTQPDPLQGDYARIINLDSRVTTGPVIIHDKTGQYFQPSAFESAPPDTEVPQQFSNKSGFSSAREPRRTSGKFTVLNNLQEARSETASEVKSQPANNYPSRNNSSAIAMFK